MPTTLTGLILFLVLLVPGFMFVNVRRRFRPAERVSAFQETAMVAFASAVAITLTLGVFALLRRLFPRATPDVGRLIHERGEYIEQEYSLVGIWALGVLALATGGAAAAGWLVGKRPAHPSQMSSWWLLFDSTPEGAQVTVGCVLDDGSWVQGQLASYNDSADDIADRDLILMPPISYGPPGTSDSSPHSAGRVVVSARRVVMMSVSYVRLNPDQPVSSPSTTPLPASAERDPELEAVDSSVAAPASAAADPESHPDR